MSSMLSKRRTLISFTRKKLAQELIGPVQIPSTTDIKILRSQIQKPFVASEPVSTREAQATAVASKSSPDRISLDIPPRISQPPSQSFAASQSAPQPAAQIATQQVAPTLIPKPAAQIVPQPAPQPTPQPAAKIIAQQILPPVSANPADRIVAQQVAPSFIPQPTNQIVFQQATPSLNAQPVSLSINPTTYTAPSTQMAMAVPARPVDSTDPETKKLPTRRRRGPRGAVIAPAAVDRRPGAAPENAASSAPSGARLVRPTRNWVKPHPTHTLIFSANKPYY